MKIRFVKIKSKDREDKWYLQYNFLFIWFNFEEEVYRKYYGLGRSLHWKKYWEICIKNNKEELYDYFVNYKYFKNSLINKISEFLENKSNIKIEEEKEIFLK